MNLIWNEEVKSHWQMKKSFEWFNDYPVDAHLPEWFWSLLEEYGESFKTECTVCWGWRNWAFGAITTAAFFTGGKALIILALIPVLLMIFKRVTK